MKESSFEFLIKASDIVSLHVPLTNLTRNMIDENVLLAMKSNAFLINTSRSTNAPVGRFTDDRLSTVTNST